MMDVAVIGGGPSGSICAISALKKGHKVDIFEEHSKCGEPENCSGLFSKEGLESLLEFGDYKKTIIKPIYGADVHFGNRKLEIRRKEPIAYVCNRSQLDYEFSINAEKEGAKINFGKRADPKKLNHEAIVGADGPTSSVAHSFNFPKIEKFAATLQSRVKVKLENRDIVQVHLDNKLFPGFFGWVIPHTEEEAEIGVGGVFPNRPLDGFRKLLQKYGAQENVSPKGWTIPIRSRKKTAGIFGKRNVLLVGDAAGQVKSTTGGGVIFGGNCAKIAGEFIESPLKYEKEWRRKFGADLALHGFIQSTLENLNLFEIEKMGSVFNKIKVDEYLSIYRDMDKPTKMIKPQFLLHLLNTFRGIKSLD